MECIDAIDIQWVLEWWRILRMAYCSLKDNCVPLVGLRIARQFRDHQGALSDDGSFLTLEFTGRTLSKICEAWP